MDNLHNLCKAKSNLCVCMFTIFTGTTNKNALTLTLHLVILLFFFKPSNLTTVKVPNTPDISLVFFERSKTMPKLFLSKVLHHFRFGRPFGCFDKTANKPEVWLKLLNVLIFVIRRIAFII